MAHVQPAFNFKKHQSKTSVLGIMTLTNSNPMTLRVFWWRR